MFACLSRSFSAFVFQFWQAMEDETLIEPLANISGVRALKNAKILKPRESNGSESTGIGADGLDSLLLATGKRSLDANQSRSTAILSSEDKKLLKQQFSTKLPVPKAPPQPKKVAVKKAAKAKAKATAKSKTKISPISDFLAKSKAKDAALGLFATARAKAKAKAEAQAKRRTKKK